MRLTRLRHPFRSLVFLILAVGGPSGLTGAQGPQVVRREGRAVPLSRIDVYGDPLPAGALARMGTTRDYIGEGSSRIIFSPDGRYITATSAFLRPPLRFWDPATGRVVRELTELDIKGVGVTNVAFSPDGKLIAAADPLGTVRLGLTDTGRRILEFAGDDDAFSNLVRVAFSPDGKVLIVSHYGGTLRFWDVASGERIRSPSSSQFPRVGFRSSFELLSIGRHRRALYLRQVFTGRNVIGSRRSGSREFAFPAALSPDGRLIAVYGSRGRAIQLRDVTTGRQLHSFPRYRVPPGEHIIELLEEQVTFSPDGRLLAAADTLKSLSLWDVTTGGLYRRFHHVPIEMGFAFSPDGKRLVTGGEYFHYWDIARGLEIHRYPQRASVRAVAFVPDGKTLATAAGDTVRLWDVSTGREVPGFTDGNANRSLILSKNAGGQQHRDLGGHGSAVTALAIASEGKTLASGAEDGSLRLLDLRTGQDIRQLPRLTDGINSLVFAPGGWSFAAAAGRDARVWDTASGREIHRLPGMARSRILRLCFSPDGRTLALRTNHGPLFWDLNQHELSTKLVHPEDAISVVFSTDGKTLATGDDHGVIRVFDLETRRLVRKLARRTKRDIEPPPISALAFTLDGKTLASAGRDTIVTFWDLATGKVTRHLTGHVASVWSIAVSPDGKTLASGSDDGTALVWDLVPDQRGYPSKTP